VILVALAALGWLLIVAGVFMLSPPAALIVAGGAFVAAAYLIAEAGDE
jgi:hypothetical protein